jgi:hypothetical protein
MHTTLVSPNELDVLATSPQCIDNQFVPQKLFTNLTKAKKKKSLKQVVDRILEEHGGDPYLGPADKDANLLLRTERNEYNRSLIYARQVVINRAAFWNSASLVVSELSDDVESLAELIQKKAIVPYLYKETALEQPPSNFDLFLGEKAMNRLVTALGTNNIKCVRLSPEKEENDDQTVNLSTRFYTEFTRLLTFEGGKKVDQIVEMLLPEDASKDIVIGLKEKILSVSRRVEELIKLQPVGREHIYQSFIVEPDTKVSHGYYRSEPFTFEIKKWVDAIYASNLPDALGILTFVPEGFPTAYDLGMTWNLGRKRKKQFTGTELIDEVVDRARNESTWKKWNEFQKNATMMFLPSPDQLTHKDILRIRELNSWSQMMKTLEAFLDPISDNGKFDYNHSAREMWESFDQFNRALSDWYIEKTGISRAKDAEKFAVGIGRVYQLGEWMVGLLFGPNGAVIPILPVHGVKAPDLSSDELKLGIEAGLFFVNKNGINWRRSQLVQRMQNQLVVGTAEVKTMIEQIIKLFPESAPYLMPALSSEMEG